MVTFYSGTLHKFKTIDKSIEIAKYHSFNAGLNDELGAFQTWRSCDVES